MRRFLRAQKKISEYLDGTKRNAFLSNCELINQSLEKKLGLLSVIFIYVHLRSRKASRAQPDANDQSLGDQASGSRGQGGHYRHIPEERDQLVRTRRLRGIISG